MGIINILLIDDETDYSETMGFWLMANGYSVRTASSGREGIDAIKDEIPDIVFLDMQMPCMDGITTLSNIRMECPTLSIIMVTAYAAEEKKQEAERIGVSGFFLKGEDFTKAAKLIADILCKSGG
ncbi:MAG: response regulator [Nitrospira sp.]|nr:response regulator [Nitrospira sp.]